MKPIQVLLPLAIAGLISGCGSGKSDPASSGSGSPSPTQSAGLKPAPGFTEMKSATFSMHLPSDWKVVDFGSTGMDKKLDEMAKNDPSMASMLPQLKQMAAAGQFKLFAFDLKHTENNFTDNINVIVQDTPNIKLDDLIKANEDQLNQQSGGKSPVKSEKVKGQSGELGLIRWAQADGKLKFHTVLGVSGAHVFTFTFTCQTQHEESFAKLVDQMIPTIDLK